MTTRELAEARNEQLKKISALSQDLQRLKIMIIPVAEKLEELESGIADLQNRINREVVRFKELQQLTGED